MPSATTPRQSRSTSTRTPLSKHEREIERGHGRCDPDRRVGDDAELVQARDLIRLEAEQLAQDVVVSFPEGGCTAADAHVGCARLPAIRAPDQRSRPELAE